MAPPAQKMTLSDYLAWEAGQDDRNEFYRGEVFAMVGVRRAHAEVAGNLFAALKSHLKGTLCRPYAESVKLQVAHDMVFYPDVFVTCDPADLKTDLIFRSPKLVAEVLSESTEAYNRGVKFAAYRQLDSLQEYLLVDPVSRRVEVYRRNERNVFELHDQTGQPQLQLESVGLQWAMAELFEGVDPAAAA